MGLNHQPWPWFAVQVRTCAETSAANHLQSNGYECFLPLGKTRRRWSDRMKELEAPLFPGYLFCRFDVYNRLPILKTPGVLQIIGAGKVPIPVEETEIAAIQRLGQSGLTTQNWPFLQVGQTVRIEHGPLRGLPGIVVGIKSQLKLILSVTLLQRSVAVELDRSWLSEPIQADHEAMASPQNSQSLSNLTISPRCKGYKVSEQVGLGRTSAASRTDFAKSGGIDVA